MLDSNREIIIRSVIIRIPQRCGIMLGTLIGAGEPAGGITAGSGAVTGIGQPAPFTDVVIVGINCDRRL